MVAQVMAAPVHLAEVTMSILPHLGRTAVAALPVLSE
jgi:hypothetical protein